MTRKRAYPPTPPGVFLAEHLDSLGITTLAFAKHVGVMPSTLHNIIKGDSRVTPRQAVRFGAALGVSAQFWLNAQNATDLYKVEQNEEPLPAPLFSEPPQEPDSGRSASANPQNGQ